jgi:DNA invertase Pin-like site-specific DNA recombinase
MPEVNQNSSKDKINPKDIRHDAHARHEMVSEIFSRSFDETIAIGNAGNVAYYVWLKSSDLPTAQEQAAMEMHLASILSHLPNGRHARLYVDNSVTRSAKDIGADFQEMLNDCKTGAIDLIVTESMFRFMRDPAKCVNLINELLALPHPVGVFFEKETVNTFDPKTKMLLILLAAISEEEKNERKRRRSSCQKRNKKTKT